MIDKTVAILAGGMSSRMNYKNKALLNYNEKTFIENIIEASRDYREIIIVANKKEDYELFNLRVISDVYKGNGPIAGIHSALISSITDRVLCIACDMPLITKNSLNYLGNISGEYEVLIPKIDDRLQPLCAIYSTSIIEKLEAKIIKNDNKLQMLISELNYKVVNDLNRKEFLNVNTPLDYKKLGDV